MNERFYQSPEVIDIDRHTPLVFLEGPVQGAPDWQTPLAERLLEQYNDIVVASPRPNAEHDANLQNSETREQATDRQVAYEFQCRSLAMDLGVLAMWFAAQDPDIPYPAGRDYGKTSSFETGEIAGWWRANRNTESFVLGMDPAYESGPTNSKNYILRNAHFWDIPVLDSLDELESHISTALPPLGRLRITHPSNARSMQRALDLLRSK